MSTPITSPLVTSITDASQQLVRELGFMESTLAGTDLPAWAVHAILEIGKNDAISPSTLGTKLNIDDSGVNALLRNLVQAGAIPEGKSDSAAGETSISLTPAGRKTFAKINALSQEQVTQALAQLSPSAVERILEGVRTYASALHAKRVGYPVQSIPNITIASGYRPDLVGRTINMHMQYYNRTWGTGSGFEARLATGLGQLLTRLDKPESEAWVALDESKMIGTIFIDGEDLGDNKAHLRFFFLDNGLRGGGIGRQLLQKALAFVDERKFTETHLWTFKGLNAARHLYLSAGFVLESESTGYDWGENNVVQHYVRKFEGRIDSAEIE